MKKFLLIAALCTPLFMTQSCTKDCSPGTLSENIEGTWSYTDLLFGQTGTAVFGADGTGYYQDATSVDSFTWVGNGDIVVIDGDTATASTNSCDQIVLEYDLSGTGTPIDVLRLNK